MAIANAEEARKLTQTARISIKKEKDKSAREKIEGKRLDKELEKKAKIVASEMLSGFLEKIEKISRMGENKAEFTNEFRTELDEIVTDKIIRELKKRGFQVIFCNFSLESMNWRTKEEDKGKYLYITVEW